MRSILFCCFLLLSTLSFSQQNSAAKWKYFGIHQAGLLTGSGSDALGVLTTNGVYKGNWYTGISTGIDYYGIRTIPLMATAYRLIGTERSKPYVYGSAGVSLPWQKGPGTYEWYTLAESKYKSGFIGEAGVGILIPTVSKTGGLTLSIGYSYKVNSLEATYTSPLVRYGEYQTPSFKNTYHFRRIALRVGIRI